MSKPHDNDHGTTRYDEQTDTYHVDFDWKGSESLNATIVTTVASVSGVEPTEMEPLYDRLDPDALAELFSPIQDGTRRPNGHISFPLQGCTVTVHSDGHIVVKPPG